MSVALSGNGLQRVIVVLRSVIRGPLLGDTWHIAGLVMTHQTIHSDFFNSIIGPFGSQTGKSKEEASLLAFSHSLA